MLLGVLCGVPVGGITVTEIMYALPVLLMLMVKQNMSPECCFSHELNTENYLRIFWKIFVKFTQFVSCAAVHGTEC